MGTRLLSKRKTDKAWVWVMQDNKPAKAFYEANGFKHSGKTKVEKKINKHVTIELMHISDND